MTTTRRLALVAVVILVGSAAMWAQGKTDEAGGSLALLTAEIRGLRLAVEESARSQSQTQGIAVYLSVEQGRMSQIASRLDAVRAELRAAAKETRTVAGRLAEARQNMAETQDAEERAIFATMISAIKAQTDKAAEDEQEIRNRETELSQALQADQARWADLIARLEQSIKK